MKTEDEDDLDHVTLQHMIWNKYKDPRNKGEDDMSTDTTKVEHLRGVAEQAFCSNAFELAAQHYRDAASILLNNQVLEVGSIHDTRELVNLLSQQSECLFRLGFFLEAAEVAEEALSINPNHVPSLYRHAISNWRGHVPTGKDFGHLFFWASAARSFERLLELDSNFAKGVGSESDDDDDDDNESFCLLTDTDSEDVLSLLTDFKRLPLKKRMHKGRLPPSVREKRQDTTTTDRRQAPNNNNSNHRQKGRGNDHVKKYNHKKYRESGRKRSKKGRHESKSRKDLSVGDKGLHHQRRKHSSHDKKRDDKNNREAGTHADTKESFLSVSGKGLSIDDTGQNQQMGRHSNQYKKHDRKNGKRSSKRRDGSKREQDGKDVPDHNISEIQRDTKKPARDSTARQN